MAAEVLRRVRVFVTGADGFVGRVLTARLRARGAEPVGTDRDELDVADGARVRAALAGARPDAVVHLAAVSFVPDAETDRARAFRVNYVGTRNVLAAAAAEAPRARVLLVSSSTVYGAAAPGAPPFDEASPLRPANAYARTKAAADLLGAAYAERGLAVWRARPWNHTGAGRPDRFVESSFARQLAEMEAGRRPPRLEVGALDSLRDFLHVEDVVDAYLALLEGTAEPGAYNVASGTGVTIRALLERLLAQTRVRPEIVVDPARVRPPDASVGSAARLRARTGWAPRRPLDAALAELLSGWRERIRSDRNGLGAAS
jgi:GDP-4-dehydro-6-deoxy-D-mannose reductase